MTFPQLQWLHCLCVAQHVCISACPPGKEVAGTRLHGSQEFLLCLPSRFSQEGLPCGVGFMGWWPRLEQTFLPGATSRSLCAGVRTQIGSYLRWVPATGAVFYLECVWGGYAICLVNLVWMDGWKGQCFFTQDVSGSVMGSDLLLPLKQAGWSARAPFWLVLCCGTACWEWFLHPVVKRKQLWFSASWVYSTIRL